MAELCDLSAYELAGRLLAKEITAAEIAESALRRVDAVDERLHTFLTPTAELAREQARTTDARIDEGSEISRVAGIPLALKDVLATKGIRSTAGSKILEPYVPPYDCTPWARLKAAGSVLVGKTNCDEFAMGSSNENSAFGPVLTPGTARACPVAPRAAARPRWPPAWRRGRSARTPAARSASRPRCAGSWA